MNKLPTIDNLQIYNILETVKPPYFQTKFPYDVLTPNKILLTKNKITIIAKNFDAFIKTAPWKKKKNGGSENSLPILIYHG